MHKIRIEKYSKNASMINSIQSAVASWRIKTLKLSELGCVTQPDYITVYLRF